MRLLFSLAAAVVVGLLGVGLGSEFITPDHILNVLGHKLFGFSLADGVKPATLAIVWNLRLPRALLAFLVGGAVAVSGAVMQSVLKNPLASSYTLGVSSGAALGASLSIITGFTIPFLGIFTQPMLGLVFGVGTVVLAVAFAARMDRNMENTTIILTGMVFSLFANALLTMTLAVYREDLRRVIFWQMGSFSLKSWPQAGALAPIALVCFVLLWRYCRELDVLTFGEEQAQSMGVDSKKVKWILLGLAAILTGNAISFVGIIGFVDLFTPHVVRRMFGASHRWVLPLSALWGGSFMVLCDLVARTALSPLELPVGAVTALFGAPFFIYLYRKGRRAV